jgi:2,5-furandicarboxylate decarboxylase 1
MRAMNGLTAFLSTLDDLGELRRIQAPVDPRFEIPAILDQLCRVDAPAMLFENVKGHAMPLVANLLGTQRRLALALGIEAGDLVDQLLSKVDQTISPFKLTEENDRIVFSLDKANAIQEILPVMTHYRKDSGAFITTGITSARDPRSGIVGRGLHRIEIRGNATLGIALVNPPLSEIYAFHKAEGSRMPVATAVGVDPAILIGTVLKAPKGMDKLAAVGGLMGAAVATVDAQSVDVDVPAYAEILLEGYIDPQEGEQDGLLGEVSGYYMNFPSPAIHITAVSMRREAVYHGLLPRGAEVEQLLALVYGLNIIPKLKREFPMLVDVHLLPGTCGSHLVMSMQSDDHGDIRRALTFALSFQSVKKAVVVNGDVDIHDPLEVEWAMATRFQADRDLIVLSGLKGQPIDPSSGDDFRSAKIGIDATRPSAHEFEKIGFPDEIQDRVSEIINSLT